MSDHTIQRALVRDGEVKVLSPDDDEVVIQEMNSIDIHVELHDNSAEKLGRFFAKVSRAISRDYVHSLETERSDGNLFKAICDGFFDGTYQDQNLRQ